MFDTPEVDIKCNLHVKSKPKFDAKNKCTKNFSLLNHFCSKKCESLVREYTLTIVKYKMHDLIHTALGEDAAEELKAR